MTHTHHAIILAAGFGSRLQAEEGHKLLAILAGKPLLDYHLDGFSRLGVTTITIVTGFRHEALEAAVSAATANSAMTVQTAYNPDFKGSNGLSVLSGIQRAGQQAAPFWLTMADHIFEPAMFDWLATQGPLPQGTQGALYVDRKLDSIFDMPDATKVLLDDQDQLMAIGKEIDPFNVVDVGLFWGDQGFITALEAERDARGDCSTSDAVRRLSALNAFAFPDIGPYTWQDVDTPEARAHAERLLASW
jgi:1L-myo-inositol 1-phosphate cytidylyltransferase